MTCCPRPRAKACSGTKSQDMTLTSEPKEAPLSQEQVCRGWGGGAGRGTIRVASG